MIYALGLAYVLRKGGYSRYGMSTLIMLIIPLLDYFLAALGRIVESANSGAVCNTYFNLIIGIINLNSKIDIIYTY